MDHITITALLGSAAKSYNMVKKAVEMGREARLAAMTATKAFDDDEKGEMRESIRQMGKSVFSMHQILAQLMVLTPDSGRDISNFENAERCFET